MFPKSCRLMLRRPLLGALVAFCQETNRPMIDRREILEPASEHKPLDQDNVPHTLRHRPTVGRGANASCSRESPRNEPSNPSRLPSSSFNANSRSSGVIIFPPGIIVSSAKSRLRLRLAVILRGSIGRFLFALGSFA